LRAQPTRARQYIEPYAGGAGAGLKLLVEEEVEHVILNDLDPGIAALWRAVFDHPDELIRRVRTCTLSVAAWSRYRRIYVEGSHDEVELGFATLFLNRTNRSGILEARPIGGLDQTGRWGVGARFDRERLAQRIRRLAAYRSRVSISQRDGLALVRPYLRDDRSFIYLDPPYLNKGHELYLDTLKWSDHERLARTLRSASNWILTYDADPRVHRTLYPGLRCATFPIAHTAQHQHVGREFAVFAEGLYVPSLARLGRGNARYLPWKLN
jgi:DNA adenine methylase